MDCKTIRIRDYVIKGDTIISSPILKGSIKKAIGVGSLSSFDGVFTDEKIIVQSGIAAITLAKIGNISEAYEILKNKLQNNKEYSIDEICSIVFEVIDEYFGNFENTNKRLSFYTDEDFIESEDDYGKISDLKGKSSAMCVERAALAQNLLKSLGINSIFKSSRVTVNGKRDAHAYNLVEYEGKYYIFDSTIPTIKNDKINPLITEIPQEAFASISMPIFDGFSIEVLHYNPLMNMDYNIIYDYGNEKFLNVDQVNKKM